MTRVRSLDRHTTFSVSQRRGEDFYREELAARFVEVWPDGGGGMTVDHGAGGFPPPAETKVFKFLSDVEVGRSGDALMHLALMPVRLRS